MAKGQVVDAQRTLSDLRKTFRLWDVDLWEAVPDSKGAGAEVRWYRADRWQQVACHSFGRRTQNMRQCFLLLERLRIAEQNGVGYAGLTSTTDIVQGTPEVRRQEALLEAYGVLGAAPDDPVELVKEIYRRKAQFFHPDKGGDASKFKRLQRAYETICESRGVSP